MPQDKSDQAPNEILERIKDVLKPENVQVSSTIRILVETKSLDQIKTIDSIKAIELIPGIEFTSNVARQIWKSRTTLDNPYQNTVDKARFLPF